MLHLKNIKIQGDFAEAEYTPESDTRQAFIRVDIRNEEIIEHTASVPEYDFLYAPHALMTLVRMAKEGDTRTERTTMWH